MTKLYTFFNNLFRPQLFLNHIWQKQIFRKYLFNTKNFFFNEFIIQKLTEIDLLSCNETNNRTNKIDVKMSSLTLLNTDLWSEYLMLWRYEEQQRLLDNLFLKSRYVKHLNNLNNISNKSKINDKVKKQENNFFKNDLTLWYQLGYSLDFLNEINTKSNYDFKEYLRQNRSNFLLEDSLEYQHKLNIHLVGVLDNLSSMYEKDIFIQSKTFRGIFLRFFREILYPWFSSLVLTSFSFFVTISELLYLISSFVAIPLLFYLFIYFILTDTVTNFDFETAWLQLNFFEFIFQNFNFYKTNLLLLDHDFGMYFNNFCWICIYLFFFFVLLFEGAPWLSIMATEEDNMAQHLYSDEGSNVEDLSDSCNLRVLELLLELSDFDFTNIDYNNYYIFSDDSDEYRDIQASFSDLNQFALQLFGGGIGIFYMMQLVIQQDDIDDNELDDLYYYDGLPRHNQDIEDDPEMDIGSFLSYIHETDSSFGLYEYPVDAGNILFSRYYTDYNIFDEEGGNIEAFVSMPGLGFDVFSENSINYFFEYVIGFSIFELFIILIILLYTLIYFKIFYDWEVWVYREYCAREYFSRISFLGWQHSLTNEEVISDEDLISNITIVEQDTVNFNFNEQLNFSRDISPHITDLEFFFEDIENMIDFKNEFFAEEDFEFIDQLEFDALNEMIDENDFINNDELVSNKNEVDLSNVSNESDNSELNTSYEKLMSPLLLHFENSDKLIIINFFNTIKKILINNYKSFHIINFLKNFSDLSNIFIYIYQIIEKIPMSVIRYNLLKLIYFYINLKKLLLQNMNYKIDLFSNHELLFLKIDFQEVKRNTIIFKIQDEIVELLITENLQSTIEENFDDFIDEFDSTLTSDLTDEELFYNLRDTSYMNLKTFNAFQSILKVLKNKTLGFSNSVNSDTLVKPIVLYPQFFQNTIIGEHNFLILDEENDLQFFFSDFEDDIEYFNIDILDVDTAEKDLSFVEQSDAEDEDDETAIFESNTLDSSDIEDDTFPDLVYADDDNPYDIFSYDFFFNQKFLQVKQKLFFKKYESKLNLLKNTIFYDLPDRLYSETYKQNSKIFNNFFLYTWSFDVLESNIHKSVFLYNVTSNLDLEFDTNYVEIDDDELYEDEHFLVPSQKLLLHSLINNYRFEYNSWLDGWGTWSFLNYNKFEGTLDTFFDYEIFHSDDDYDIDEEEMIEMNLTFFADTLQEMYNDNLVDEPSDFIDSLPELSGIFDDLDDFEEDFVEHTFLVEKPAIFFILFILFFECFTIFFIEYYFILFIFLEPENGDNFFSDLLDFRYTGIFYDILKLKSYDIYLFIFNFLTIPNNFVSEIKLYQFLYYSVFCLIDESSGIVGVQYSFFQQYVQQNVMLYFMSIYEEYVLKFNNYFYSEEEIIVLKDEEEPLSVQYFNAYWYEKKDNYLKFMYYLYYLYYKYYEIYIEYLDSFLLYIQYVVKCFYFVIMALHFLKLKFLIVVYWLTFIPGFFINLYYFLFQFYDYCLFCLSCEELNFYFSNFLFFFNNYVFSFFLFFWRFSLFDLIASIDLLFYIMYNGIFIGMCDFFQIQLLSLFDFLQYYRNGKMKEYFVENLKYIYSFQYNNSSIVKKIVFLNKQIDAVIHFWHIIIIQLLLAQKNIYIIITNIFNYFFSINITYDIFYLFIKMVFIDIKTINYLFTYLVFCFFTLCSKVLLQLVHFLQILNYDLYVCFWILQIQLLCIYLFNIYTTNDAILFLPDYTINRHHQFDDKFYYNNETLFNIKPEILYDIETVTFINSTFDSYLYWY